MSAIIVSLCNFKMKPGDFMALNDYIASSRLLNITLLFNSLNLAFLNSPQKKLD